MRARSLTREIRRVYQHIDHALHDRGHDRRPGAHGWRRIETKSRARPGGRKKIADVMQTPPVAVRANGHLDAALGLMLEHGFGGLPVIDSEGCVTGVLTERDVLKIFYQPDATDVASVMSRDFMTVPLDAPLVDVLDHFMASHEAFVPVHDRGKLVGVIHRSSLVPKVIALLQADARARRLSRREAGVNARRS